MPLRNSTRPTEEPKPDRSFRSRHSPKSSLVREPSRTGTSTGPAQPSRGSPFSLSTNRQPTRQASLPTRSHRTSYIDGPDALIAAIGRKLDVPVVSGDGDLTHEATKQVVDVEEY